MAAYLPQEPASGRRQHMRLSPLEVELREHNVMGVNEDAALAAASPTTTTWASARTWEGAPSETAAPDELETARPSAVVVPEHRRAEQAKSAAAETAAAVDAKPWPQVAVAHAAGDEGRSHTQCNVATAVQVETPRWLCCLLPQLLLAQTPPAPRHSSTSLWSESSCSDSFQTSS